jgi:hypothetical protein
MAASVTGVRVDRLRNVVAAARALPGQRPLTHVMLHSPAMAETLERRVAVAPPDVVLAYCTGMARYALEPPLAGLPFLLDMVDVDSEKWAALGEAVPPPRSWICRRRPRCCASSRGRL